MPGRRTKKEEDAPAAGKTRQGLSRREAAAALRRLTRQAVAVLEAALAQGDVRVAQWIVELELVKIKDTAGEGEPSPRMKDEEARAELLRRLDSLAARQATEGPDPGPPAES